MPSEQHPFACYDPRAVHDSGRQVRADRSTSLGPTRPDPNAADDFVRLLLPKKRLVFLAGLD